MARRSLPTPRRGGPPPRRLLALLTRSGTRFFAFRIFLVLLIALSPSCEQEREPISSEAGWAQVASGQTHSCGLRDDGTVACWGCERAHTDFPNDWGQCDAPSGTFVQVAAGRYHSCALADDGTMSCWGCGFDSRNHEQCTVPDGVVFIQISVGEYHTCGLVDDGTVLC